jgi:hypothetical protein
MNQKHTPDPELELVQEINDESNKHVESEWAKAV